MSQTGVVKNAKNNNNATLQKSNNNNQNKATPIIQILDHQMEQM